MKITSRQAPKVDPLDEGTKYLAYVQSKILERHYALDAIPGSVKLVVTVQSGQVITEMSYIQHDGNVHTEFHVESVDEVLEGY